MRQRKAKDLDKRMEACGAWLTRLPLAEHGGDAPGAWERDESRDLFLEIGCGKGDFLIAKALADPGSDYLGMEGQETVLLRALEKARETGGGAEDTGDTPAASSPLSNLRFVCDYVRSLMDLFPEGSLAGIYLNFSDPWPKARHVKRRLTWRGRLKEYAQAIRPGGAIEFKTDNDDLFAFTLEEIAACGWTPAEETWDLHGTDLPAREVMTEYEKKFLRAGKKIHYVKVIV